MKTLILTVGLPRSGKSTWAKQQGFPIVCPDAIRLAIHERNYIQSAEPYVWAIAKTMVQALFIAGHDIVILDATNNTRERRDAWLSDNWEVRYKYFCAPKEECIRRAKESGREDIIPIIERMWLKMEGLTPQEQLSLYQEEWQVDPRVPSDRLYGIDYDSMTSTKPAYCPKCGAMTYDPFAAYHSIHTEGECNTIAAARNGESFYSPRVGEIYKLKEGYAGSLLEAEVECPKCGESLKAKDGQVDHSASACEARRLQGEPPSFKRT